MIYILTAGFALILAGLFYRRTQPELPKARRILLFSLRSLSIWILLLILFSPVLHFTKRQVDAPQVLILRDISLSMDLKQGSQSKKQRLATAIDSLRDKYDDAGYQTRELDFADGLTGGKGNTLLVKSLRELGQKQDLSAVSKILLASDGWFRDEDFSLIFKMGIPIHPVADTSRYVLPDLEITAVEANRYAYRNEPTLIRARVRARNYSGPARANLFLGKARVASRDLDLEEGSEEIVDFTHRFPRTGFFRYQVELEPLENEQRLGNNQMPGALEVLSEKELMLVISDAPAWDNKFILDAIATNPRWQSKAYQVRDSRLYRGENLATLDRDSRPAVIVVVNNGELKIPPDLQSYITGNLERGCGLLYQGMPISILKDHLPLLPSNLISPYQGFVQLNDSASIYPMLSPLAQELTKLPPLDYYYLNPAPRAQVLGYINNPQKSPAIAVLSRGPSRALGIGFLNLWRWQMQSPDAGYQKMMVNILTWLSNKAIGAYSAIYQTAYLQGEEVTIRLRAEDEIRSTDLDKNPVISIFDAEGKELSRDFMSRSGDEYSYTAELSEVGDYRFEISEPDTNQETKGAFAISEMTAEERDFGYNLPLLNFLASDSRGQLLSLRDIQDFQPPPAQHSQRTVRRDLALYKKWYIISLFILSFCLELFFRRRWGLL